MVFDPEMKSVELNTTEINQFRVFGDSMESTFPVLINYTYYCKMNQTTTFTCKRNYIV